MGTARLPAGPVRGKGPVAVPATFSSRRVRRLLVVAALALPGSAAAGAPAPTIVASTLAGPAPLTVRLTTQAAIVDPGPAIASYAWSFGDGTAAAAATSAQPDPATRAPPD